jgi:hypothetical protein
MMKSLLARRETRGSATSLIQFADDITILAGSPRRLGAF